MFANRVRITPPLPILGSWSVAAILVILELPKIPKAWHARVSNISFVNNELPAAVSQTDQNYTVIANKKPSFTYI